MCRCNPSRAKCYTPGTLSSPPKNSSANYCVRRTSFAAKLDVVRMKCRSEGRGGLSQRMTGSIPVTFQQTYFWPSWTGMTMQSSSRSQARESGSRRVFSEINQSFKVTKSETPTSPRRLVCYMRTRSVYNGCSFVPNRLPSQLRSRHPEEAPATASRCAGAVSSESTWWLCNGRELRRRR